jgi:hypothetical protein
MFMLPTIITHTRGWCFSTAVHGEYSVYCSDETFNHTRMQTRLTYAQGTRHSFMQDSRGDALMCSRLVRRWG